MINLNENKEYNISVIMDIILNRKNIKVNNMMFCNAIRLAIGKDPIKYSSEYPKSNEELDGIITDPIVANDVY